MSIIFRNGYTHLSISVPRFSVFPAVSMDNCVGSQLKLVLCMRSHMPGQLKDIALASLPSISSIVIFPFPAGFSHWHMSKLYIFSWPYMWSSHHPISLIPIEQNSKEFLQSLSLTSLLPSSLKTQPCQTSASPLHRIALAEVANVPHVTQWSIIILFLPYPQAAFDAINYCFLLEYFLIQASRTLHSPDFPLTSLAAPFHSLFLVPYLHDLQTLDTQHSVLEPLLFFINPNSLNDVIHSNFSLQPRSFP